MDFNQAERYVKRLLKKHELNCKVVWTKATRYHGMYVYWKDTIRLSKPLTLVLNKEEVYDSIKHEISHALDYKLRKKTNHDEKWKMIAKLVGCKPMSFTEIEGKDKKKIYKYLYFCVKCDYTHYVSRLKTNIYCPQCNRILYIELNKTIII